MIIAGAVTAAAKGEINLVTEGILKGSEQAVLVVAGLIGMLTFWSGIMRIARDAGLIERLSRLVGPLAAAFTRTFT